jgi:hypothetical protein
MIKDLSIEDIRNLSIELLSRTFLELRQTNISEDDIVSLSLILAEDLKKDFYNMEIEDIKESFRLGIRNTDDFLIGPKVWYKWIKKHRQLIWNNEGIDSYMQDKRLAYRSKEGTGLKKLSINDIKMIK